jgi:acyl-coenzyme A synthetase/AMP-(fatty) acid ligase
MSPRNTATAIIKLLQDTSCHRLLTTQETLRLLISEITSELSSSHSSYDLSFEEVPPLLDIFPKLGHEKEEDAFQPYPSGVRPPLDDVLIYLHSSGSTGFPKTIRQTFKSMVHWASFRE